MSNYNNSYKLHYEKKDGVWHQAVFINSKDGKDSEWLTTHAIVTQSNSHNSIRLIGSADKYRHTEKVATMSIGSGGEIGSTAVQVPVDMLGSQEITPEVVDTSSSTLLYFLQGGQMYVRDCTQMYIAK